MPLEILRRLAFDGQLTGFLRQLSRDEITGVHLEFDVAFLRHLTERIQQGLRIAPPTDANNITNLFPTFRSTRRQFAELAVRGGVGFVGDLINWQMRCREMGYAKDAKPVVITIDFGEKASPQWLRDQPRRYEDFPIRYRFSPAATSQLRAGSSVQGADLGTLGGIVEDSVLGTRYGITCSHVAGGAGTAVSEVDPKGKVLGGIGTVTHSTIPPPTSGSCNLHSDPAAGLDAALVELNVGLTALPTSSTTIAPIVDIDQDDLVTFYGGKSGSVNARVASATIWKKIDIGGQLYCFGDMFSIGHRQAVYVAQSVSQGGDSGSWIFEDPNSQFACARWIGMLVAGDKQHNQSLASYGEHVFAWGQQCLPNLVLPP